MIFWTMCAKDKVGMCTEEIIFKPMLNTEEKNTDTEINDDIDRLCGFP